MLPILSDFCKHQDFTNQNILLYWNIVFFVKTVIWQIVYRFDNINPSVDIRNDDILYIIV